MQHKEDFRELAERHPASGVFHANFGQVTVGKDVIERQWHRKQE